MNRLFLIAFIFLFGLFHLAAQAPPNAISILVKCSVGIRDQVPGFLIDVDSENGREEILFDVLPVIVGIAAASFVTDENIEIPIFAEVGISSVVVASLMDCR